MEGREITLTPEVDRRIAMAANRKNKSGGTRGIFVILAAVVCVFCSVGVGQPWDGNGVERDPYRIWTAEDMQAIGADANYWDAHFMLMADIDLSAYTGTSFNIIGIDWYRAFTGVFDGNGHIISNFTYDSEGVDYVGLFGYIKGPNAEVRAVGLTGPSIKAGGGQYIGSLAGFVGSGNITNCYVEGGSVRGERDVGGLVGSNHGEGRVVNSYSTCSVTGTGVTRQHIGGLVGNNQGEGSIVNSYSTGSVRGNEDVGGLVGRNDGDIIIGCYSAGSVMGASNVGGLVGYNRGDTFNCYSAGSVRGGSYVGGLIGYHVFGDYSACFWDNDVNPSLNGIGNLSDPEVTGLSTVEMQMMSTYTDVGWDFIGELENGPSEDWAEPNGGGYPILWWQLEEEELPPLPVFSGGSGDTNEPYLISTGLELNMIGHNGRLMGSHFRLIADIDLSGIDFFSIGSRRYPLRGVFDGNGHAISNLRYDCVGINYYIGLFGYISGPNAKVKNLGLIDPNVSGRDGISVGGLAGFLTRGVIRDCYVEGGIVRGEYGVGGLVGRNDGDITGCYSAGSVTGVSSVGGLVGSNYKGDIQGCYSTGSVTGEEEVGGLVGGSAGSISNCHSMGSVTGEEEVGGLVGHSAGSISNCYSTCSVSGIGIWGPIGGLVGNNEEGSIVNSYTTGDVTGAYEIGGLVGYNDHEGEISACYSTGSVTGRYHVGGLVGDNRHGYITSCYCTGSVTGESGIGGLVGYARPYVTIENCYSTGSVAGIGVYVGGLVGRGCAKNSYWDVNSSGMSTSSDGIGLTTKQMQSKGTYLFWGCEQESWTIDDGSDYPRLWWEGKPGEVIDFGCGTAEEPYLIYEAVQMQIIGDGEWNLDKHYKLMADIDLGGYRGRSFNMIGYYFYSENSPFRGVFDGGGHAISNFTYDSNHHVDYIGLFGWVDDPNAEIKNLGLTDPDVNAGTAVGCLIGHLVEGIVTDCYVEGGSVRGRAAVGGLVGYSRSFKVLNCYSTASVTGEKGVGGLVGYGSGNISNSYSSSSVTGDREVGGLVGSSRFDISNCYSSSSVTGGTRVGGLVGYNRSAVFNCYSSGSVAGDSNVGGLVGYDYKSYGDYTASFWDSEVNPDVNGIGNLDEPNVVGLPTMLMQTKSTFADAGWDFSTPIWKFCSLPDYPKLAWEWCPGPLERLVELVEMVEGLGLAKGIENSLLAKVEAAGGVLEDDNEKNDGAAVNILGAFINAASAQSGKKIPESQADALIAEAAAIIEALESR